MKILGIETSCDETSIALVHISEASATPDFSIEENLVASQIEAHRPYGGVVPNIAKREHEKHLPILLDQLLTTHPQLFTDLDFISVTVGPGLEPALWQGITFAQELGQKHKIDVVGTNHLHGHMYSFLLSGQKQTDVILNANHEESRPRSFAPTHVGAQDDIVFPTIQLLVSGGHTTLFVMESLTKWKILGETRDDAAGEAFDKVGRLLGLPYPGGPEIDKIAPQGDPNAIPFPRPMIDSGDYDFSFSGLKTAVLYYLRDHDNAPVTDVAASFQKAAMDVLVMKTMKAVKEFNAKSVLISGGVAANRELQNTMRSVCEAQGIHCLIPPNKYLGDNAAMIGTAGYFTKTLGIHYPLEANGNLSL